MWTESIDLRRTDTILLPCFFYVCLLLWIKKYIFEKFMYVNK